MKKNKQPVIPLKLLVVDDDPTLCRNLKGFFERQDYKVNVAHDGTSALKLVETWHPDMMFLDIGLPGISGIQVLQQAKMADASLRVIMITGNGEAELMRQARVLGADDYIVKPFTLAYLSGEVIQKLQHKVMRDYRTVFQELGLERDRLELLFGQVKEGVIILDTQGLVLMANPVALRLLELREVTSGLRVVHAFKHFLFDAVVPGSPSRPAAPPPNPLLHLNIQVGKAFDLVRSKPLGLVIECRITPIFNPNQRLEGYLVIFRDVTEERKALGAMKRFIGTVTHKLRTPLMTISGYPSLLLAKQFNEESLTPFQKEALEIILSGCRRLQDTITEMIAFSCLDPEEHVPATVPVSELIQKAVEILSDKQADKAAHVIFDPSLQDRTVYADALRVPLAFYHLLQNAFKFGAHEVTVSATGQQPGDVTVLIHDDGPGIAPEDHERIFEQFYQVDKEFTGQMPGAGLGLTIVKQIIEAHSGHVRVESAPGHGTTFAVTLPTELKNI